MAGIQTRKRADGTPTHRVHWRDGGRTSAKRSLSFDDYDAALRFQRRVEQHGGDAAIAMLEAEIAVDDRGITLGEWLTEHIDHLTGVQPGTLARYRRYAAIDLQPIADTPLAELSERMVSRWIQGLAESGASGKTVQNKHGFLSGALKAAVRAEHIKSNPCEGHRLPRTEHHEMVMLSRAEFDLIYSLIPQQRWKDLAMWLVSTGMRFGEATALRADDIDAQACTARIARAWKYNGSRPELGPPKTRRGVRTINIPEQALRCVDLTRKGWLFTNAAGNPARSHNFFQSAWQPARAAAAEAGLRKAPRIHDLRHTCASWMLASGVPIHVVSSHLGHENIQTTVNVYGHVDRAAGAAAAAAISAILSPSPPSA